MNTRILYVAMRYDYGRPEQGRSFEHCNFFDSLHNMGIDVIYFDFPTLLDRYGREGMNARLLDVVRAERPDVMFTVLFRQELDKKTVRAISEETETATVNWFCDDHWRFDDYSRRWAPCFNWSVTTAQSALPKYEAIGYEHVIKSQWACNHFLYKDLELPLAHDVTFVGQPHGDRRAFIEALQRAAIDVKAWGGGWELGRLSQDEMIRVFNQSRVNLNLSNASLAATSTARRMRARVSSILDTVPFGPAVKRLGKKVVGPGSIEAAGRNVPSPAAARRAGSLGAGGRGQDQAALARRVDQIKGRNFEIPGCGGFQLTGEAEDLGSYYEIGSEIVTFTDAADLIEKARYYLEHEEERAAIARAGYERTLREHTYEKRFTQIFERMGVEVRTEPGRAGEVEEVA